MATGEARSSKSIAYWVNSAICLTIMFGFGQLPAIAPLTPLGMNVLGIFFGLLYGWITVGIVWPSIFGLMALMLVGGMRPKALFNASFGDPIVVMMFFIFIFCATISYYGLSRFISLRCITIKAVSGKPWAFTFVFLLSIFLLGGLTSSSPAVLIGWSILYAVCDLCGYKKGEAYPTMMVFGVAFAAQIGMSMIPFKQVPLTVIGAFENMSGMAIDYATYMLIAVLCCIACAFVFVLVGKLVFKPDMSKLQSLDTEQLKRNQDLALNKTQRIVLGFLIALVVLLLLPSFLPEGSCLKAFLGAIGSTGVCVLLVGAMCLLRVDGKALLPFKKMVDRRGMGHHIAACRHPTSVGLDDFG